MFVYDNLGSVIASVFVAGIVLHFVRRWRERRLYFRLRAAYVEAVRLRQATDCDPATVVREEELRREFMRVWLPGWFEGLWFRVKRLLQACAALTLAAFLLKELIERRDLQARRATSRASVSGHR
jgi:hypothetical protein